MRAAPARRLRPATTPATHALFEKRSPGNPGTPSQWVIVLVELDAESTRTLHAWHGTGPLGRLRAWRDALEHCAAQAISAQEPQEEPRKAASSERWEHARLRARLRAEGVLEDPGTMKRTPARSPLAVLIATIRNRRKGRQRYRRKSLKG